MPKPFISTVRLPGFISFLCVAFINAVVDSGHKILIQNTIFKSYDDSTQVALAAIVNALLLLPYILLFTPAGFLSDRFSKPKVMRMIALMAIVLTSIISIAYYQGWFWFAFAMTLLMGVQSAIYSPAKYGYIKEIAGEVRLAPANSFIQAITIVAILSGMIIFTILFESILIDKSYASPTELIQHLAPIGIVLVALSTIEFFLVTHLPKTPPQTTQRFDWSAYRKGNTFKHNFQHIHQNRIIWFAILGLAMFWSMSQTLVAVFPAFAKIVLAEDNTMVIQGLIACSGIGIIVGSLIAGLRKQGQINTSLIPIGAIGLSLVLLILPWLNSIPLFTIAILVFGLSGGLFIVPLNALIQKHADLSQLGRVLAGSNWLQNWAMIFFLVLTFVSAQLCLSSLTLMHLLPIINLLLSGVIFGLLVRSRNKTSINQLN